MLQFQHRTHTYYPLLFVCFLLCLLLLAACGPARNPDECNIIPPTGYPMLTEAGGVVYLQSERSGSLYALRASDGSLLWKYHAGAFIAMEHGMVYVQGINDTFYALRASDGHVLWQYDMSKDVSGVDAVVDGLVYFNSSNTLTMYVLRGSDGVRLWQHKIDADHYPSHILAANGIVYVSAEYSRVTALRESDGVQLWQYDTGTVPPGNPLSMVLANGVVYAVSNQTTALRASDGTVLWHFSGAGPLMAENDVVYVSADQLYALRASDGRQLWHWHFPISTGVYSLTLNNGIIYAGPASSKLFVNRQYTETYTNHLYALKDSTGSLLWDHALPQSRVVIRVSGGSVYTLSRDALDVLQSSNGSLLWHHPLQQVGLLVADGTVYAGTAGSASTCFPLTNSKLTALRPTDGTQFWQFEAGTVSDPTLN